MKKEKLLIIGAGGHGKVVADIAMKMNEWKTIRFLDSDQETKSNIGIKVIGRPEDISLYIDDSDIFVGIGNNSIRENFITDLEKKGASIPNLIHPTAIIGKNVKVDNGTAIMAGTVINCSTKIGKGCIINTGSTIDHDNIIGDYVHMSPGVNLAGQVSIGNRTWLGIGSSVINNITVINDCVIGAGAVVVKSLNTTGIYIGVPAKKLKA